MDINTGVRGDKMGIKKCGFCDRVVEEPYEFQVWYRGKGIVMINHSFCNHYCLKMFFNKGYDNIDKE